MKVLKCPKCNRTQQQGKYCLDCGGLLIEVVTSEIKLNKISSSRTSDQLKRDIRRWLVRIGVQEPSIKINTSNNSASIEYTLEKNLYTFSSHMQDNITNNLAAVEQFLHFRVLGIERGIETVEKAFAGYEAIPDYTNDANFDPYTALGFATHVSVEEARIKFKVLAKKYHPDVNASDFARNQFQRIKRAIDEIEKEDGA